MAKQTLKEKTITGVIWSSIEFFSNYLLGLFIGVILARLLTPKEFGIVATIYIFEAIAQTFTDGGFRLALIRKQNCTNEDYSTVFYLNLGISILCYIVLFFSSSKIAVFFKQPELTLIMKVYAINIIFFALNMVQVADLHKKVNFKSVTKITVITVIISGIVGVVMAFMGFGVWSLVVKELVASSVKTCVMWFSSSWRPNLVFSKKSFNELFGFGSKMIVSSLLNRLYTSIYKIVIAKFYSAAELAFYHKAEKYRNLPSINIKRVLERVTYPIFSSIQDDDKKLKESFRKVVKPSSFVIFILLFGLAASGESFIISLIGNQWIPVIKYMRILCVAGFVDILSTLNLNVIQAKGRSDLILLGNVIKKITTIPAILVGIFSHSMELFLWAMSITIVLNYGVNSYWAKKLIQYPVFEQLKDILPSFLVSFSMAVVIYFSGELFKSYYTNYYLMFLIKVLSGLMSLLVIVYVFRVKEYFYIKNLIIEKMFKNREKNET